MTLHTSILTIIQAAVGLQGPRSEEDPHGRRLMAIRWTRIAPQIALTPALAVTLVAFVGSILWTIYLSFTRSRRVPDYAIDWRRMGAAVRAPVPGRRLVDLAVEPHHPRRRLGARHRLRLRPGRDDRPREARRELLPHRVPLPAGGVADRHRRRLALDPEPDDGARGDAAADWGSKAPASTGSPRATPRCTRSSSPRSGSPRASTWR